MKIIKFIKDTQASITIEMVGIFSLLILLIALVADLGNALTTQTKLNNLSYSLASLVRERAGLYPNTKQESDKEAIKSDVTRQEVLEIYTIAKNLIKDSSIQDLTIIVQSLSFRGSTEKSKGRSIKNSIKIGEVKCDLIKDIEEYKDLSFFTKFYTWSSLYQVTVCAKEKSSFAPKISQIFVKPISSSIVYGR